MFKYWEAKGFSTNHVDLSIGILINGLIRGYGYEGAVKRGGTTT